MELARRGVLWPYDYDTREVLDLAWLDLGTAKPVTADEDELIEVARRVADPSSLLYAPGVRSEARTEYHRRIAIARFGRNFLHQPPEVLGAGDVRGVFYLEWAMHIDQMKREGRLKVALALALETAMAADAVAKIWGGDRGASGWYLKAALILRKLRDLDGELALLQQGVQRYPESARLADQLNRALVKRGAP
ncbi:hypothetical protein [Microbacterium sp. SORGH_AS_0888]|uniref:hypothetical protein n=1 Tax=Microbacterium sp. SORGH_AS_0888 TaxID=3041791 RepID=UPI0027815C2B|nr:hypothetical protein [Microbacterium sp. SORGH_AS_0888]MDQ1131138.1 hypothetical protein [Microbacterium sp. SORGH_AS_0888]